MYSIFIKRFFKTIPDSCRSFQTSCKLQGCCGCGTLQFSPNSKLDKHIADKYLCLPMPECVMMAEYIWIDGTGQNLRSKVRTFDFIPQCVEEYPKWVFNGEATHQDCGHKSPDMILVPAAVYNDPFRRGNNKLVLCEVYTQERKPCKTNFRAGCAVALKAICHEEPMFGVKQDFIFADVDDKPYGWPMMNGEPSSAGSYYASLGSQNALCRDVMECIFRATLYSGITFHSAHTGYFPSMWQYSTGPTVGIKAADDLWMARYIITRIAEEYGLCICLKPKPYPNWPGLGASFQFSTKGMREEGGLKYIEDAICRLSKRHLEHLVKYDPSGGMDNVKRLTGKHDSSCVHEFTNGVGLRNVSVRILDAIAERGMGYFQDRRPAANCDAYSVIEAIIRTCLIDDV